MTKAPPTANRGPSSTLFLIVLLGLSCAYARDGIVLQDNVKITASANPSSKIVGVLSTGNRIDVSNEEKDRYAISHNDKKGWVNAKDVFVFDDGNMYSHFISSTYPLSIDELPETVKQKAAMLNTYDFYARAIKNTNATVREHAALRVLYYESDSVKLAVLWQQLQRDADPLVRMNANETLSMMNKPNILFDNAAARQAFQESFTKASGKELDSLVRLINAAPDQKGSASWILNAAQRRSPAAIALLGDDRRDPVRPELAEPLIWKYVNDSDPSVRESAYDAVIQSTKPEPRVLEALVKRYPTSGEEEQENINRIFRAHPTHASIRLAVRAALKKGPYTYSLTQTAMTLLEKKSDADLSQKDFDAYIRSGTVENRNHFREVFCVNTTPAGSMKKICSE